MGVLCDDQQDSQAAQGLDVGAKGVTASVHADRIATRIRSGV